MVARGSVVGRAGNDRVVVDRIDPSVQRDAVAAYESLLDGDVEPLVAMLCAGVEWNVYTGPRLIETVTGRDRVADRLASRARTLDGVSLRGLVLRRSSVDAEFSTPWWRASSRLYLLVASITGGTFTQTLELGAGIDRIDNRTALVAPLTPEAEMFAFMLGR